ncbi:MAG: spore coat protein U domain-containing protein [Mariprofundus sp.]|nr:spore coat protein U domain-containing protein [Mariprofundus sp.]
MISYLFFQRQRTKHLLSGLALLLCCWATPAWATCTVSTTSTNFGIYWGDVPLTSTGSIGVSCAPTVGNVQVLLDAGQHTLGSFVIRKMQFGNSTLNYNLYISPSHTTVWGDGTDGSVIQQGQSFIVYGYMPAYQVVAAGTYTDLILVTIVW